MQCAVGCLLCRLSQQKGQQHLRWLLPRSTFSLRHATTVFVSVMRKCTIVVLPNFKDRGMLRGSWRSGQYEKKSSRLRKWIRAFRGVYSTRGERFDIGTRFCEYLVLRIHHEEIGRAQ